MATLKVGAGRRDITPSGRPVTKTLTATCRGYTDEELETALDALTEAPE